MTTAKSKMLITLIYMIMAAYIVTILPRACDIEYEREHPISTSIESIN